MQMGPIESWHEDFLIYVWNWRPEEREGRARIGGAGTDDTIDLQMSGRKVRGEPVKKKASPFVLIYSGPDC